MEKKKNWDLISFVLASDIRSGIINRLNDKVQTPTELKKAFDVPISRISAVLKELTEKKLIENLTPERRKSKIYALTGLGKETVREIHKLKEGGSEKNGK